MQGNPQRREGIGIGKDDRPGNVGFHPVTATGKKTTPSADGLAYRYGRSQNVRYLPNGHFLLFHVPDRHDHGKNQTAVINQASLPEFKNFKRIGEKIFVLYNHIHQPGSQKRRNQKIKAQVDYFLWIQALLFTQVGGKENRGKKTGRHQKAVGEYFYETKF